MKYSNHQTKYIRKQVGLRTYRHPCTIGYKFRPQWTICRPTFTKKLTNDVAYGTNTSIFMGSHLHSLIVSNLSIWDAIKFDFFVLYSPAVVSFFFCKCWPDDGPLRPKLVANSTGVLISLQPDLLPDVFCLMVRIFRLMLVLLYI